MSFKILIHPETRQGCQKSIYKYAMWEPIITKLVMDILEPGQTFIDVGAANGWFSLIAASIVGERGKVIAFEPNPTRFKMLLKGAQMNGFTNLTASDKALSYQEGTAFIGGRCMGEISESGIRIVTTTLDHFLAKEGIEEVHLVKIDVEGVEQNVLKGMIRTVENNPSMKIICELHPRLLERYGDTQEGLLGYVKAQLKLKVKHIEWRYWLFIGEMI